MSYINDTNKTYQKILLQSNNRTDNSPSVSDCYFQLQKPLYPPTGMNFLLHVDKITIPYSFYSLNENNDTLNYTLSAVTTSVTFEHQNPDALNLQSLMNTNLSGITCTYSIYTNKYTWACAASFSFNSASTIFELIGLSTATTSTLSGGTYYITSDAMVNLAGTKNIFVMSDFINDNIDSRYNTDNTGTLLELQTITNGNGYIFFENKGHDKILLDTLFISQFHLWLEDDDANLIDLNGKNWAISLHFNYIYARTYQPPTTTKNSIEADYIDRLQQIADGKDPDEEDD